MRGISNALNSAALSFAQAQGLASAYDAIKGTPSTRSAFGVLCKAPKIDDRNKAVAFTSLEPVNADQLLRSLGALPYGRVPYVEDETPDLSPIPLSNTKKIGGTVSVSDQNETDDLDDLEAPGASDWFPPPPSRPTRQRKPRASQSQAVAALRDKPTLERMAGAFSILSRALNRAATASELLAFYEDSKLNTGEDRHKRRQKRAAAVVGRLAPEFRPTKAAVDPYRYLSWVRANVSSADLRAANYVKTLTLEDVAVFLAVMTPVAESGRSAGKAYAIEAFRNLKAEGKITRSLDNKKRAALVRLCQSKGLLLLTKRGAKGRGSDAFSIGPNHPSLAGSLYDTKKIGGTATVSESPNPSPQAPQPPAPAPAKPPAASMAKRKRKQSQRGKG